MENRHTASSQRERSFQLARTDLDLAAVCIRASQTMASAGSVGAVLEGVRSAIAHLKRVDARMVDVLANQEIPGQGTLAEI